MPNTKGGKKFKSRKKTEFREEGVLLTKDPKEDQEYAQITNAKGNGRFELKCCDNGKTRLGIICGKMRKRCWVNRGDMVLICKWEDMSDDTKCSIIHKYSESDAKRLKNEGELPENFNLNIDEFEEVQPDEDYFSGLPSDSSDESGNESGNESDEINLDEI